MRLWVPNICVFFGIWVPLWSISIVILVNGNRLLLDFVSHGSGLRDPSMFWVGSGVGSCLLKSDLVVFTLRSRVF